MRERLKLLHVEQRNKLIRILRIKTAFLHKFLLFFLELIFPIVCYGCACPGKILCSSCLRVIQKISRKGRCLHCFQYLEIGGLSCCAKCNSTCSRYVLVFYLSSNVVLSLYEKAEQGKKEAILFFCKSIQQEFVWEEIHPRKIFYIAGEIVKDIVIELGKRIGIPVQRMRLSKQGVSCLQKEKKPICIISTHCPPRSWLDMIEYYAKSKVWIISLFLNPDLE
ncbi:hypothetical protein H359_0747 [Chlamydia ibidis 10-1398/6]|nr:hypothetical protein H359_0747 [Chlamydia ibidis 10-1398/6]